MTAPASDGSVEALVEAGRDHVNHGSPVEAAACYSTALERLAHAAADSATDRLRTRAHLGLALAEVDRSGDVEVGIAHLGRAEAVLPADAHDLRAALLGQRGILLARSGRLEEALATFESAEDVLHTTTPSHRAMMLLNRGWLHLEVGHGDAARVDLERAVVEAGAADQPRTAYKARHNLAYVAFLEGDLPRAIDDMAAAARHDDGSVEDPDPITLMDRGRVLLEAGLVAEADDLLARAQADFEHQVRGRDLGEVTLVRADAAVMAGDPDRAGHLARAAAADFEVAGNQRWRRRALLVALAADRMAAGSDHDDDLRVRAGRLADEAVDDLEVSAGARLVAAELAAEQGDVAVAERELALVELPDPASVRLRLRWHVARAALAAAGDQPVAAVRAVVDAGITELVTAQSQLGSRDLRTAMALHGRPLVERGLQAAIVGGDPLSLHHAVDLAHAASRRLTPVRAALDDHERRLVAELRAVEERQWREPDAPTTTVDGWARRSRELRNDLRQRAWRRQGEGGAVDDVVALPTHQRELASVDAIGVSYLDVGGRLAGLVTTPSSTRLVWLGAAVDVTDLVERLRADLRVLQLPGMADALRRVVHASLVETLSQLDEIVMVPLAVEGHDVVVVPHGALAVVPWSLLPSRRGVATVTTPSATSWTRGAGGVTSAAPMVRALAGPDLERASEEVAAVARTWSSPEPAGTSSTADLRGALASADVVHLAAHGTHRADAPLFSSVRLADGSLFAHELDGEVTASLVVLSACDVGVQSVRPGDEPLGLAAVLLDLGVDTVVGSVAPIRDDVAARTGADLHRHLAAGATVAHAVTRVAQDAWTSGDVAPMVVLGRGLHRVV